MTKEVSK